MTGFPIGDKDYISYFVNSSGEEAVFVQKWGVQSATLLHSDMGWEPQVVKGPTTTMADAATEAQKKALASVSLDGELFSTPLCGDMILDRAEARWIDACHSASEPLRDAD